MKRQLVALAGLLLAAVGGVNQAWQRVAAPGQIDSGSSTAAGQATQPSTTLVIRGTIQKYDPASKVLTLSTPNGTMQFTLTSAARIRQSWHRLASTLEQYSGFRAAVWCLQSRAGETVVRGA